MAAVSDQGVTPVGPASRSQSSRASAYSDTPRPAKFLDIIGSSDEEWNVDDATVSKVASKSLDAEESSHSSTNSNLGNEEHPQTSL